MKNCLIFSALFIILASCNGNHTERYSVDINELKTLPDNFYHYRGRLIVHKDNGLMIWYNTDSNGNITNIWKVEDNTSHETSTAEIIEKYALDTIKEKIAAVRFTQLSHKYHFGHINVDHKNKIAYSTNEDIVEEYVYPFNDSVTVHYQKDNNFKKFENGWFKYNHTR